MECVKRWANNRFSYSHKKDAEKWIKLREQYHVEGLGKIRKWWIKKRYQRINYRCNASIPLRVPIGEDICCPHGLCGVFISIGAEVGSGCTIFQNVTIGTVGSRGSSKIGAPIIGNNVFIGAGATIVGGIRIGDNVRIGANATIFEDIPSNCTAVNDIGIKIIKAEYNRDNSFRPYKEIPAEEFSETVKTRISGLPDIEE